MFFLVRYGDVQVEVHKPACFVFNFVGPLMQSLNLKQPASHFCLHGVKLNLRLHAIIFFAWSS